MKKITIVSPCFNEEDNVENCYSTVKSLFEQQLPEYELEHIFVDNASADRTVEILRNLAGQDSRVKVVVNSRNFGPFRSTFNGLKYATGNAILVMLPVDLQDPPELIPEFVRHWENGIEIVAGARSTREESFTMRLARRAFYRVVNRLSQFEIPPDVGEFQLVDRAVLDAVLCHRDHYPYIRGIIASCGFKRLIIPYVWRSRKRGFSKANLPVLIDQALNGIFSFTNVPMRICALIGFVLAFGCMLTAIVAVILYFLDPGLAPRGVTAIVVSVLFLSGVQLSFIGILGEYVASIHAQVRGGLFVVERERINIPGNSPESNLASSTMNQESGGQAQ